jgi:hypothetical protein
MGRNSQQVVPLRVRPSRGRQREAVVSACPGPTGRQCALKRAVVSWRGERTPSTPRHIHHHASCIPGKQGDAHRLGVRFVRIMICQWIPREESQNPYPHFRLRRRQGRLHSCSSQSVPMFDNNFDRGFELGVQYHPDRVRTCFFLGSLDAVGDEPSDARVWAGILSCTGCSWVPTRMREWARGMSDVGMERSGYNAPF